VSPGEPDTERWDPQAHPVWCSPEHCTDGMHRGEQHQVSIGQGEVSLRLLRPDGGRPRLALVLTRRDQRMYVQLDVAEARAVSGALGRLVEQLRLDALAGQAS
jgi:hypothetical protein